MADSSRGRGRTTGTTKGENPLLPRPPWALCRCPGRRVWLRGSSAEHPQDDDPTERGALVGDEIASKLLIVGNDYRGCSLGD